MSFSFISKFKVLHYHFVRWWRNMWLLCRRQQIIIWKEKLCVNITHSLHFKLRPEECSKNLSRLGQSQCMFHVFELSVTSLASGKCFVCLSVRLGEMDLSQCMFHVFELSVTSLASGKCFICLSVRQMFRSAWEQVAQFLQLSCFEIFPQLWLGQQS